MGLVVLIMAAVVQLMASSVRAIVSPIGWRAIPAILLVGATALYMLGRGAIWVHGRMRGCEPGGWFNWLAVPVCNLL